MVASVGNFSSSSSVAVYRLFSGCGCLGELCPREQEVIIPARKKGLSQPPPMWARTRPSYIFFQMSSTVSGQPPPVPPPMARNRIAVFLIDFFIVEMFVEIKILLQGTRKLIVRGIRSSTGLGRSFEIFTSR